MRCAWQEYISILPPWMRQAVDDVGKDTLLELRLRINYPPDLVTLTGSICLDRRMISDDLCYIVNAASQYSPWATETVSRCYITASGGHRIGICGEAITKFGEMVGIRSPTSLCVRVARDYPGIAKSIPMDRGSILIIGKPGSGKTTLLRDLIRQYACYINSSVGVVDERGELFPVVRGSSCFPTGSKTDIITGCSKKDGILSLIRTMGPGCVAVDEITQQEDSEALIHAGWCGVNLLATAHAFDRHDLFSRSIYAPLLNAKLFSTLLIMQKDKSWKAERL